MEFFGARRVLFWIASKSRAPELLAATLRAVSRVDVTLAESLGGISFTSITRNNAATSVDPSKHPTAQTTTSPKRAPVARVKLTLKKRATTAAESYERAQVRS